MMKKIFFLMMVLACLIAQGVNAAVYDVRKFGAKGDGKHVDSYAINKAILAAGKNGGGVINVPAGEYLCYSIRLTNHIEIHLEKGATIIAATPTETEKYDDPEDNPYNKFQDFGHSHWKNSLFWGIGLQDVSFSGEGLIDGKGLLRVKCKAGQANKAIALKECRNVNIRDIRMFRCGHFALLATGVDNMTISNVMVDSNRDGFDVDCCRNVRITGCSVNTPWDDAIVLKSSYALGYFRDTENVTISDCFTSGYDVGALLNATWTKVEVKDRVRNSCGRIKLGTETSAGFKNVAITNCVFEFSGGLLLESVDGGALEDVVASNLTMRNGLDSPLFIRLGARMRTPEGAQVGTIRRVLISDVNVYNSHSDYPVIISGIPQHSVEDIILRNVHFNFEGGVATAATGMPVEAENKYPDPWMFGEIGCKGLLMRHARNITFQDVTFSFCKPDNRPLLLEEDTQNIVKNNFVEKVLDY